MGICSIGLRMSRILLGFLFDVDVGTSLETPDGILVTVCATKRYDVGEGSPRDSGCRCLDYSYFKLK